MIPFKVAIVGRPNVGKSSFFNRLIGQRHAITDDQPGITRDRLYAKAEWQGHQFQVIDTGGIDYIDAPFLTEIKVQAEIAMDEADVIVMVVDGISGIHEADQMVAKILFKRQKEVILVVNKIDDLTKMTQIYEFYGLGLGDPIGVSTIHGIGIGDVLDKIVALKPQEMKPIADDSINFAIVGRPNVGKSSLLNAMLNQERVITSPISGTTRDAIDTYFTRHKKHYVAIDTAGIKKRGKIYESFDKYSLIRAMSALERADVALLVIDGHEGVLEQDKHVGGLIQEYFKAVVIVVNKWDIIEKDDKTMAKMEKDLRFQFQFFDYAQIIFVSALEKLRLDALFEAIVTAYSNYHLQIKTSIMNEVLHDATLKHPAAPFNNGRANFTYITQSGTKPPTFQLFVNHPDYVHFSYERYLKNAFREAIDFTGTPIKFMLRKKVSDEI
jgi:GTP-binding protein